MISRPATTAVVLTALLATASAAQEPTDEFFDTSFDGGWVGNIQQGKSSIPFQLQFNVGDEGSLGFVLAGGELAASASPLAVFGLEFTRTTRKQVVTRFDGSVPLGAGRGAFPGRFASATLKLGYKPASDSLAGKISGALKGKVTAVRMTPDRPLQRIWQSVIKRGGATTLVQLAGTESEDGELGGQIVIGDQASAVSGTRNGASVTLQLNIDDAPATFSGKLKTKNNKLQGTFMQGADRIKATFVPADGNGKPLKFRSAQRQTPVAVPAGEQSTIVLLGTNIALGAIAFVDSAALRIDAIKWLDSRRLQLQVTAGQRTGRTTLSTRLLNADGEVAERANLIEVVGEELPPVSYTAQIQPIFTANCALAGCHLGTGAKAGLDLDEENSFNGLVNVPSVQVDMLRVVPGNADSSYLVRKLEGSPGIRGVQMPKARPPLAQSEIDLVRAWINQGAVVITQ